jgi:hypothetical protein
MNDIDSGQILTLAVPLGWLLITVAALALAYRRARRRGLTSDHGTR